MAPIPGSVRVTGFIAPSDSADTYASHSEVYGYGGYRTVANAAARLAVTADRRKEGMLVKQLDTGEIWTLIGGIADINWVLDPLGVADSLRKLVNMGGVYFVDTDAGVDAAGRGTFTLPLKTINYAITNYAIAYNNDLLICWGSAGGGFDENTAVDGVEITKESTVVMGIGLPYIDNTNGAATSVVHISASGAKMVGFWIFPTTVITGILVDTAASWCFIGDETYPNKFTDCSTDVYIDGGCSDNTIRYNWITGHIGLDINGATTHVYRNDMVGDGMAGSIGIKLFGGCSGSSVYECMMTDYVTGLGVQIGTTGCMVDSVSIRGATTPISDPNPAGSNLYTNIQTPSMIGPNYTLTQDLKAIYDAALTGGSGMSSTGVTFYVDTTGSDANPGTFALPFLTIDYAVGQCVDDRSDIIVVTDRGAMGFDENVNVGGIMTDVSNVTIFGVGLPHITNSNGGATDIITIDGVKGTHLYGVVLDPDAGVRGINDNGTDFTVIGSEALPVFIRGGSRGIYKHNGSSYCTYAYNHIEDCTQTGIYLAGGHLNTVYKNTIMTSGAGGSVGIAGDIETASFIRENDITRAETGISMGGMAPGCMRNVITDNNLQGCTTPMADTNPAGSNFWENNHIPDPWVITDVDSQLTVANGTNTITISTPTNPIPHARFKHVGLIINGAYAGGGNDSFKAHAAPGSYLEAWVEIQTPNDANWRRLTPSNDAYRLYQNNVHDCLNIDDINGSITLRIQAALSVAPTDTIDLDWQILFDVSG